ncbi:MAG: AMP-binding protein [Gammaproteobacteria bacterium]
MTDSWTVQALIESLSARGEAPALVTVRGETVDRLSYAALADNAKRLASGFQAMGMQAAEPVAILAPNGPDWAMAWLGLGAMGALIIGLDDLATDAEHAGALANSGCRRIVTNRAHAERLGHLDIPDLQIVVMPDALTPATDASWANLIATPVAPLPSLSAEQPAILVYTSGTTGQPKGFVLTSANLWANLQPLVATQQLEPADCVLLPLPLHHVYPLTVGLLTPLLCGATVVFPESVAGPAIIQALRLARVTTIIGVPRLYSALGTGLKAHIAEAGLPSRWLFGVLLAAAIGMRRHAGLDVGRWLFRRVRTRLGPRLRLLVSGGARLEPDVLWLLVGLGFKVRSGYGLAETASIFTGNLRGCERPGSEGQAFQGGELRIVEKDADGVGEIQLRGPNVFTGYRQNPAANRDVFTPDGWLRTGDLGWLDTAGFLYVTGRIKETLVLGGGKKIHPEELEKFYGASPYVQEIAVLEQAGSLVALVRPNLAAVGTTASIHAHDVIRVALMSCAQTLPSYQRLSGFALVREPLPRTRLEKYQRFLLPALYERALAGKAAVPRRGRGRWPEDRVLPEDPRAREIYTFLEARYPDKPLSLEANPLLDIGIDSLEMIGLSLALEERFGIRLDEERLSRAVTIEELLGMVSASEPVQDRERPEPARQALSPEEMRWIAPASRGPALLAALVLWLNWFGMHLLFRVRLEGRKNLPRDGGYVLTVNHASDLDPWVLAALLGRARLRNLYWGGDAKRVFSPSWRRGLLRALRVFPVDEHKPAQAVALAKAVLARDQGLIWFPEGWETPDGHLQAFLPGIGRVLKETGVAAVPVYIDGTFAALPRHRKLPRFRRLRVVIGRALDPEALATAGSGETSEQRIADALHEAVAAIAAKR